MSSVQSAESSSSSHAGSGFGFPSVARPSHVPEELVFDFDIYHDERIKDDIQGGYMSLHRDAPDVFWTPRNGGHWLATRFDDVKTIGENPEIFSSVGQNFGPTAGGELPLPPQNMDAPDHMRYRLLLLKFLSPRDLKKQEGFARRLAIELIEKLAGRNSCDFKKEVAVVLPVTVFMTMMQWDHSRLYEMIGWVHDVIGSEDQAVRAAAFERMSAFLQGVIQDRLASPGDDPISVLLASKVDGQPVSPQRVLEMCYLLFTAGLDTVTNAMTYSMHYLATDPAMQQRLRANPGQLPQAIEEFLRRFSFPNTVRRVKQDVTLGGARLKAGDVVICGLAAASNDDRKVPHPGKIDLDRPSSPHVAFMAGPHTCIGAPLARTELRVLFEEWFKRMPDVSLAPGFKPVTRGGGVPQIDALQIVW